MGATISQRELRNDSGLIMRRVEAGETLVVTRNGTPVADLVPHRAEAEERPVFVPVNRIADGVAVLGAWGVAEFERERTAFDDAVDDVDVDPWQR